MNVKFGEKGSDAMLKELQQVMILETLQKWAYKINEYDRCVANTTIK